MRVKAGKATRPSEGLCGKEVDAGFRFAAWFCMGRSPCEQLRRERNRTGGFRVAISPEELAVAVLSLEEEPGHPRVSQNVRIGSCQHFHLLLQCVPLLFPLRAGLCRGACPGSPRKFWLMCLHFSPRRVFPVLLKDIIC